MTNNAMMGVLYVCLSLWHYLDIWYVLVLLLVILTTAMIVVDVLHTQQTHLPP